MRNVASDVAHLLRRAGFGGTPTEIEQAAAAGYQQTVEALLAGTGGAPDPQGDQVAPPAFATGTATVTSQEQALLAPLQAWWLNRMIVTSTPLREKMTLLWHGQFATSISGVSDPKLMYLQNQTFRTLGAGTMNALTQAIARGGAMMSWLNIDQDKKAHPNENFARELMERFTIGVGAYTQTDVEEGARCFTGWIYDAATDQWQLQASQHDTGTKTFLGVTGNLGGQNVVDTILARPESARFVAANVWSHLAYPVTTTDVVVRDLVQAYGRKHDLTALLRAVFNHPAFTSSRAKGGLVKQPIEYVVGAARALRLDADLQPLGTTTGLPSTSSATMQTAQKLVGAASSLAQTPFAPTNVGGWPQNLFWLNSATSLARLQFAMAAASVADVSAISGASTSQRPAVTAQLLGLADGWGATTAAALAQVASNPRTLLASALTSPEYVLN